MRGAINERDVFWCANLSRFRVRKYSRKEFLLHVQLEGQSVQYRVSCISRPDFQRPGKPELIAAFETLHLLAKNL